MSPNPNKQVLTGLTAPSRYYSVSVVPSTAQVRLEHDMVAYITAASSAKGDSNSNNAYSPELWRIERRTSDLPINSTLANITLPFFAIDSFEWITDPEQTLDSSVLSALDLESTLLNFAGEYHPLYASSWGYVALIPNRSWNATFPSPILSFPSKIVIGAYHVLITVGDGADVPCEEGIGQLFEYLPPTVKMLRLPQPNAWCLAFAHVSIRTGAGTCRDCRVAAPLVVRNQSTIEPEPDNMAEAALYVMPEVSTLLSQLNVTQVSPRNGLEQYIRETLTLHYCGTWNVLALRTVLGLFLETMVKTYVQVSEATVNRPRVIAWLVLNVCVAACCGAIAFVQASTGRRRVVVDSTLASVLLDATEVVNGLRRRKVDPHGEGEEEEGEGGREISNMSILLDDEKQTRVKLIDGDDINEAYARFKLVPDTRSSG
ncbi:hypothetical protein FRC17_003886 [Serendipita sp. 399]|nr:hypothetical protein FRC17_003886 [Serendipita sp. 399]